MLFKIFFPLFFYCYWLIVENFKHTKVDRRPFLSSWVNHLLCMWLWRAVPFMPTSFPNTGSWLPWDKSSVPSHTTALPSSFPLLRGCSSLQARSHFKLCYKDFSSSYSPQAFSLLCTHFIYRQLHKIYFLITVLCSKINSKFLKDNDWFFVVVSPQKALIYSGKYDL